MNTFSKNQTQIKWTWKSPDNTTKNKIDYIMSNNRKIIKDVTVLNRFDTVGDHRLVIAIISVNFKQERKKLIQNQKFLMIETLRVKMEKYQYIKRTGKKFNNGYLSGYKRDLYTDQSTK